MNDRFQKLPGDKLERWISHHPFDKISLLIKLIHRRLHCTSTVSNAADNVKCLQTCDNENDILIHLPYSLALSFTYPCSIKFKPESFRIVCLLLSQAALPCDLHSSIIIIIIRVRLCSNLLPVEHESQSHK